MRLKHLLFLAILAVFSLPSVAEDSNKTANSEEATAAAGAAKDSGQGDAVTVGSKPIVVEQASPRFTVRLNANATTGFQWFLMNYDHDLIRPTRSYYQAGNSKLVGAPGMSVWEFQVLSQAFRVPQVTHLEFEYRRPWEARFGNRQAVIVIIQPAPKADKQAADVPRIPTT
jgi:inhibitor of cysteine peptidase